KIAARCMAGQRLDAQGVTEEVVPGYFSVKEAVFPFIKFPGVDPILGPEMKSTGEVMGMGRSFAEAFAKSQLAAGVNLPQRGRAFISVREADKRGIAEIAADLLKLGFELVATRGTAAVLEAAGVVCTPVNKVTEGRPHIVDMIKNDEINLIVNTTEGKQAIADSFTIRREALQHKVTYTTTLAGARATCQALTILENDNVYRLQDMHEENRR
ncbi:MAG: carbamoyl phosphate synthase large subunit, partial [Ectothiorhodospiraceae bacterium]|nr:carbamoyl phosphate synthase large subunit [Ectothiorhodospiraceae bacterium]